MYLRPETLSRAVQSLADHGGLIMAGGTDVFPAHVGRPLPSHIVDVTRLPELRGITRTGEFYRFGGAVRWSEVAGSDLPPMFDALKAAAREVGSVQIQNRATIAGNLCNASPAADGIPPLLALDAEVELVSVRGSRRLKLADFMTGYRSTARAPDEILSAVLVPVLAEGARSAFRKLGSRRYLVISIIMVAAVIRTDRDGLIAEARVALGAASPVARRLETLESDLRGVPAAALAEFDVSDVHLAPLTPIDDVRATAAYRLDAASALVGRALLAASGAADA
jgi:CO/xanthine dehydrogenase FAD-binding subunit